MSIITISRGCYSRGKEVAEKVARKLGYDCISRDILLDASEQYNIPEFKLERAIHHAPSILDRFIHGKERYIAYIQSALLKYLKEDNIVYHGLAGHFFLKGVSHVLKVRIIADMEDRIKLEMERDNKSYQEALRIIKGDDEQRRKWSMQLYGIDTHDSSLYDLVIHIGHITVDDAADIICSTVGNENFKVTPQSRKAIESLSLAAEVKAVLIEMNPTVETTAVDGKVFVRAKVHEFQQIEVIEELRKHAQLVKGVREVEIQVLPTTLYSD